MRFGTDKSSVLLQRSSTHSPLKGTKSQEDLRLSPEFSRLLNSISNWSPKSRYLQLIAEKKSLENQSYKPIKRSHSQERKSENKFEYKSLKNESKKSGSSSENKSKLKSDSKVANKEPIFNNSKIDSETNLHTNVEIVHKGKQQDNLDSVNVVNKVKSRSSPNLSKAETKSETKMNDKSSKLIINDGSKSVKKKQDKDNSVEPNLRQELHLTDDEKASILATKQHSLTKRVQTERESDQLKKLKDRLFEEEKASSSASPSPLSSSPPPSITSLSSSTSSSLVQSNETYTKSESKTSEKDLNKTQASNFVKKRFINNGFKSGRFEATFKPTQSMVSEARIKWERNAAQLAKDFLPNKSGHTSSHSINKKCTAPKFSSDGHTKPVSNTIKPFLAKGSVAERVLMFEKRPEIRKDKENKFSINKIKSNSVFNNWKVQDKNQNSLVQPEPLNNKHQSSLNHQSCPNHAIPRFYFPAGRPYTQAEIDTRVRWILEEFSKLPERRARRENFQRVVKVARLPLYWKEPLFLAIVGNNKNASYITDQQFVEYWRKLISNSYDEASKFVKILTKGQRNYLIPEDFIPLMQDVIESHPGLGFLKEAVEFHSRYIHTVISRIFYCANKSWSGMLSIPELRKSNFLAVLRLLEEEEDINQITDYFSYEHFYVIYCKFWELDQDHDLIIDKDDLMRHNDAAISSRMIDRVFSGAVTRGSRNQSKMTYSEFVWFLLSEEDKRHPRSIEYWFRCMDLDGDGYLSMYELEYFYEEQVKRMEVIGIEALPFNDCLCQMLDMVNPKVSDKISLSDLKKCRLTPFFFDTFFNLDKYLEHEQRDPFSSKDQDDGMISDWDRFASDEYELLVAEESGQNSQKH